MTRTLTSKQNHDIFGVCLVFPAATHAVPVRPRINSNRARSPCCLLLPRHSNVLLL